MKKRLLAVLSLFMGLFVSLAPQLESGRIITGERMECIANAIENYRVIHGRGPAAVNIDQLAEILSPRYIAAFPFKDAWGKKFHFCSDNKLVRGEQDYQYWIGSGGRRGNFEGFLKYILKTGRQDNAIVFSNGKFL